MQSADFATWRKLPTVEINELRADTTELTLCLFWERVFTSLIVIDNYDKSKNDPV